MVLPFPDVEFRRQITVSHKLVISYEQWQP
jgi:hypothetical protein